jgi:predicted MFS family arabinose efflux permease
VRKIILTGAASDYTGLDELTARRTLTAGMRLWAVAAGGLAATLIGNGIGRFAYTPLIPALIAAGWFTPADAVYLAAANLVGYLLGALVAGWIARLLTGTGAIRLAALATVASLVACAWPLGFAWYAAWRLLAGVTGGVLMVLAVPAVLAATPPAKRGRAAGVVITGIGLGIAMAGTVVPATAQAGLTFVWLVLAAMALLLTIYVWIAIPRERLELAQVAPASTVIAAPIWLLLAAYSCDALGFIPHTVFWVDYIARGLGRGLETGGAFWIVFGLGAAAGPFLAGVIADHCGLGRSYVAAMAIKAMAVALPLVSSGLPALFVSSFVVGALIAGTTTLCSAWIAEQVGLRDHRRIWGWMTSAFAVAQAAGAWALSLAFAATGSYALLFTVGAASLATGAALASGSLYLQRAAAFRGV